MIKLALSGFVAAAAIAAPAQATVWFFQATLDGLQEVPPVTTNGMGTATATLDDVTGAVVLTSGTFNSLSVAATAAHIHGLAAPGSSAGVLVPLVATPATSGTLSGGGTLTPAQVTGMLSGLTYINVHTSNFPGGEIRGQLTLIPTPGVGSVLALGGLLALRRRR